MSLLEDVVWAPLKVKRRKGESGFAARVRNEMAAAIKKQRKSNGGKSKVPKSPDHRAGAPRMSTPPNSVHRGRDGGG